MRSTMPDFPLTLQHFLWRSTTLFPTKEIVTRRETGRHRYTYADFGGRVAQLAHGLKHLGVSAGDRVGTLAWNNYRHLELYFAVPGAGAVLHTLNPRLFPEHLQYVINDAEDKVIFVDASLLPALQRIAKDINGVQQFVVMTDGPSPDGQLKPMVSYEELLGGRPTSYPWPQIDERDAAACATRRALRGNRRALSTAIARRCSTPSGSPSAAGSACRSRTAFCPSCRCSTPTPGASPMPPRCWGPSKSLPTGSSTRSASPNSSGKRESPSVPACPASGSPCFSTSTRPGPTCEACGCSSAAP